MVPSKKAMSCLMRLSNMTWWCLEMVYLSTQLIVSRSSIHFYKPYKLQCQNLHQSMTFICWPSFCANITGNPARFVCIARPISNIHPKTRNMEVSLNRGTPKHFIGIVHYKPSIWGYPHFRKPPYEFPWHTFPWYNNHDNTGSQIFQCMHYMHYLTAQHKMLPRSHDPKSLIDLVLNVRM